MALSNSDKIAGLKADVKRIDATVGGHTQRLTRHDDHFATIATQLQGISETICALEKRVAALEAKPEPARFPDAAYSGNTAWIEETD